MDEQARAEQQRKAQEASRQAQDKMREVSQDAVRIVDQLASAGAETLTVWTTVNQAVMDDMLRFSSRTMEENTRLMSEMQRATMDGVREWQLAAFRWQAAWPEMFRNPMRWYQRTLEEWVHGTQRGLDLSRRSTETLTHSFERMQDSTGEVIGGLEERFRTAASRMQDVTSRVERLRAA